MKRALAVLIALACLVSLCVKTQRLNEPFADRHAWVSAHFSIMARNYLDHGFWRLRFAPVQNSGPLEPKPDYYLHWPFLFQVVLAFWSKVALWTHGQRVSEFSGRLLASLVSTGTVLAVAAAHWRSRRYDVAAVSSVAAALLPVQLYYGSAVIHIVLAAALWSAAVQELVAVVQDDRSDRIFLVWAGLGMLTSWEVFLGGLAPVVLWFVYRGHALKRCAIHTGLLTVAIGTGLFAYMAAIDPSSVRDTLGVAVWRAGITTAKPQEWFPNDGPETLDALRFILHSYLLPWITRPTLLMAVLGCMVVVTLAVRRELPVEVATPLIGFAAPPVAWTLLLPRHARYHDYELLIAVPLFATLIGWGILGVSKYLTGALKRIRIRVPRLAPIVLLLALTAFKWPTAYGQMRQYSFTDFKEFGETLARETASSDRIITDVPDQTVDYYAGRRIYRVASCNIMAVDHATAEIIEGVGEVRILFATWSKYSNNRKVCPTLPDAIDSNHPRHEFGKVELFELRGLAPGGGNR